MSPLSAKHTALFAAISGIALVLGACHHAPKLDPKAATLANFTRGMNAYLGARGDVCLSKQFPVDITDREFELGARNALQMPALEHAGLVTSVETLGEVKTEEGTVPVNVRRYHLTETGMRYYLSRPTPGMLSNDGKPVTLSDLCAVKLSLNEVVGFELSSPAQPTSAVVTYTYRVAPAPWLSAPEIQQVFPAVAQLVRGARTAQLKEGFTLTPSGWVASDLATQTAEPVANR